MEHEWLDGARGLQAGVGVVHAADLTLAGAGFACDLPGAVVGVLAGPHGCQVRVVSLRVLPGAARS